MTSTPYIEIDWSSTSQHSYPQLGEPTSPENDSENILHNTEPLTVLSSKDIFFLDIDDIYPFTYSTLHFEDDEMEETYDNEDYFQQLLNTALNAEIEEVRLEGNNIPSISNTPLTPIQDNIPLSSPDTVPISENLPKDGKKTTLLVSLKKFHVTTPKQSDTQCGIPTPFVMSRHRSACIIHQRTFSKTHIFKNIKKKHEPKSEHIPTDFINDKSSHTNLLYYRWLNGKSKRITSRRLGISYDSNIHARDPSTTFKQGNRHMYQKLPVRHLLYKHSDSIPNADDYPFLVPYFTMDSNHKKQIMTKLTQASSSTGPSAPPNNYNPIPDVFIPKKYRDIIPKDLIYMNDRYVTPGSREWFTYMYNVDESYYPPESRTPRYNAKGKYVARTPIYRSEVVENYVPSHIVEKSQLRRTEKLKADALTKEAAYHGTTSKYYNSHANIVRSVTNASNSFHECMPKYLAKRQQNHEFGFSNATLDKNLNKFLKNNNI
ncbi:uncharacterized protein OCT59_016171 [Rhizophagus irregularis]|uniref:uncharacterized protein n=1 Tax=Rhizophagus irregularis TaxID=588596 RepID=UPI003321E06D|nr:hypothetical protein OCT59_016171 [Rhizophagus irregularis]